MGILRDKNGKPEGVIREIAGGQQRLYDIGGNAIATYRPGTDYTYDNNGCRIGSGKSPAGTS
ncbi:MAG: hypothetical protein ACLPHI_01405 [Terriglobales bacterium]